jgi:hypothetical protein
MRVCKASKPPRYEAVGDEVQERQRIVGKVLEIFGQPTATRGGAGMSVGPKAQNQ